jgi:hypothetical protein
MPPKHDLSGGNQSEDSFATSKRTSATSANRCFFAARGQEGWVGADRQVSYMSLVQFLSHFSLGAVSE